ncbi:MAG: cation transporter [Planctomycetaceae bacterium]|nr:cation transporter [Planctomycetaceae bacterium]
MSCDSHHTHRHHQRGLAVALVLAVAYMAAEAIGGWLSGSLALWADAGHMLSDAGGLGLSLLAGWFAARPGNSQQTFGNVRAEILAATINGAMLIVVALGIAWEAWERMQSPQEIDAPVMAAIAFGGLMVNLLMLKLLHGDHNHNLNIRGAWLHVVGDTLGSVAVLIAAACIPLGWLWMDPAVSMVIAAMVVFSAWKLLAAAVAILMEQSPESVPVEEVRRALQSHPGVAAVHCLHVWSLASSFHSISAHVVLEEDGVERELLVQLRERLQRDFHVEHITLQLEPAGFRGCDEAVRNKCRPTETQLPAATEPV